jgi:hypothetical protein
MRNRILIHLGESGWLATYQGAHTRNVIELFGTATIPTAYTSRAPIGLVIAELRNKNPGVDVLHWLEA